MATPFKISMERLISEATVYLEALKYMDNMRRKAPELFTYETVDGGVLFTYRGCTIFIKRMLVEIRNRPDKSDTISGLCRLINTLTVCTAWTCKQGMTDSVWYIKGPYGC
jgi:hypothetical protein